MPTDEVTIAEMLKSAGYKTALFGKWHLGTIPECEPLAQGFDEFLGHRGGCIDNYSHFFYWVGPNRHDLQKGTEEYWEDGTHFSDIVVREAGRFIEENKDQPFFLYLPFNIPHYPVQGRAEFREMYKDLEEPRRAYAALVSDMDRSIGNILEKLDRTGLRKNTIVIFLSDHGHSTEERTNFGGGDAGPYRGAKFSLLEGGIRVPCIVSWPGEFPQGEVRDQMATSLDWYPTIAEVCGAKLPDRKLDGKNLLPVIESAEAETQHEIFHWQQGDQWAVREGTWKLVLNAKDTDHRKNLEGDDKVFLSDLSVDVTETRNVAKDHPDVVARLTEAHEEWEKEVVNR
jgi:arylsulfatase A-like enzyme